MPTGRTAELTGLVRPEVESGSLDQSADEISQALDESAQLQPDLDLSSFKRKVERAMPGGDILGDALGSLGGGGPAPAASGDGVGLEEGIQAAQLETQEDILDAIEKLGASGGAGGGGGGGGLVTQGLALQGVRSLGIGSGIAGAAGAIGSGGLLAGAGVAGSLVGGWALQDIASGGEGFSEVGDLGESFSEQFPELGEGIETLFTENPFHDLGEDVGDVLSNGFQLQLQEPEWMGNTDQLFDDTNAPDWLDDAPSYFDGINTPGWLDSASSYFEGINAPGWLDDLEITLPNSLAPGSDGGDPLNPPSANIEGGPDLRGAGERLWGDSDDTSTGAPAAATTPEEYMQTFTGSPNAHQRQRLEQLREQQSNRAKERRDGNTNVGADVQNNIQADLDISNMSELQDFLRDPQGYIESAIGTDKASRR